MWTVANKLLIGGATKLYGLSASTGAALYTEALPSPTIDHFTSPSAAGGRLFVATGESVTAWQVAQLTPETPVVEALSPAAGPVAGGLTVAITGGALTGATEVRFGAHAAKSFAVKSARTITAVAPAGTAGTVEVSVTTAAGRSAAVPADRFTYLSAPRVRKLSPSEGPTTGATTVTITGSGFTAASKVTFATSAARVVGVPSATTITAQAPAHAAGTVEVAVTTAGGRSAAVAGDRYTYVGTGVHGQLHGSRSMELEGLEPSTFAMPWRRSPS